MPCRLKCRFGRRSVVRAAGSAAKGRRGPSGLASKMRGSPRRGRPERVDAGCGGLAEPSEQVLSGDGGDPTGVRSARRKDALRAVEQDEDHWFEADIHRLRGELISLSGGGDSEAEGCYQRALALARGQGARLLELRAVTGLARH